MGRFRFGVIGLAGFFACLVGASPFCAAQVSPSPTDGSTVQLANLEQQFKAIASAAAPSVVAITASAVVTNEDAALRGDALTDDKLESWLTRTARTVGTGFIIDADGYILTNEHVVSQADQLWVATEPRKLYPAIVVGSDPRADLAIIKIPARNLKPVRFAGTPVERGAWSISLGNPFGLAMNGQMSMSVGIVSAIDRSLSKLSTSEQRLYTNLIQTTAEINPGNSGGPLFNLQGEVIGISTAVVMPSKSANGIGFAFPITHQLLSTIEQLKQGQEIRYAYLGVMVSTMTADQRRDERVGQEIGVRIDTVEPDSPASETLRVGDYVLDINGTAIANSDDFIRRIGKTGIGEPARLNVRRAGESMVLPVKLRERELPSVAINRQNQRLRWRGMLLGPIPGHWEFPAPAKKPEGGLMVLGVDPQGPSAKTIQSGAIITAVAGKPVRSIPELQEILNNTPPELCKVDLAPAGVGREVMVSGE